MRPRFATLAGLGAFGGMAIILGLFALIAYASIPRPTGGIDRTQVIVTWISVGVAAVALAAFHVVLGRGLIDLGRDGRRDA